MKGEIKILGGTYLIMFLVIFVLPFIPQRNIFCGKIQPVNWGTSNQECLDHEYCLFIAGHKQYRRWLEFLSGFFIPPNDLIGIWHFFGPDGDL